MGSTQGLRKPEAVYFVKVLEGQDNATKEVSLVKKGSTAQNARFNSEIQSVVKRSPIAYYNTTAEPGAIMSTYRYYRKSNDTSYLLQLNGTSLKVGNDSTGSFTTLWTLSGSSGYRFTAVTYNDLALISTGKDNIIQTDGTAAWELGSCKATANAAAGSVNVGTHRYAVVFNTVADGTGTHVVNGAVSNSITIASSAKKIDLSNIPLGPTSGTFICLSRTIYRTKIGAPTGTLYKVAVIGNNTETTYLDNIAEAALTDAMPTVTDEEHYICDMPRGKFLYLAQERLFVSGDWYSGTGRFASNFYYSDYFLPHWIATYTADATSAAADTTPPTDYYEVVGKNDNDFIVGMASFLGTTYVIKQNSVRAVAISGTPDTWSLGDIITTQGTSAGYSIVPTPYGIVYQGRDYVYVFNGNFATPLFGDFLIRENVLAGRIKESVATYWKGLYLLAYTEATLGHQYHDRVLIYDMVYKQVSIDKGGPKTSGYVNINCFAVSSGGTDEGQMYAGDSFVGHIYKYENVPDVIKYAAKSEIDTGTHNNSMALPPENNSMLTRITIDNMEEYTTDALAQAAWVGSETTASMYRPPNLGDGSDGDVTISADTTITADMNYDNLTIDAGDTLTATNQTIRALGTITVNGAFICDTIAAYTIVVGAAGVVTVNTASANTITVTAGGVLSASGAVANMCLAVNSGTLADSATDGMRDGNFSAPEVLYVNHQGGGTGYAYIYLRVAGSWVNIQNHSGSGLPTWGWGNAPSYVYEVATGWDDVTGIRMVVGDTGPQTATITFPKSRINYIRYGTNGNGNNDVVRSYGCEIQAWGVILPTCYYKTGTGSLPASGSTSDFVKIMDVTSEDIIVNERLYSLKVTVPEGANTLNESIVRTISSADYSSTDMDTVLLDIYSNRTGANFQFGYYDSGAATWAWVDVPVATADVWETIALDMSAIADVSKDQVTKLGFKFTNTDAGNVVYIDNIRPAIATCSWTSPVMEINASLLGSLYWNEYLGTHGSVEIATRNGAVLVAGVPRITVGGADCTWSTVTLSNPAGTPIITYLADGTTATTDPVNMKYFQFKVTMTTSTAAITKFANAGSGYVTVTSANTLSDGDEVTIYGTTSYNGVFTVSSATATSFNIIDTFVADDATGAWIATDFPYLYVNSTFMMKFDYFRSATNAETSVEFQYETGYRNFDTPLADKIFKKIISIHEGEEGNFYLSYGLDYVATWPTFEYPVISLVTNPRRYEAFFPDSAFGRDISVRWYKNDLYDFKVKQVGAVIESEPII